MFPIRIIQDKINPKIKWIIRKENIYTDKKIIYNFVPFYNSSYIKPSKNDIKERLNEIHIPKSSSGICYTDLLRKLTPQEYFKLSKLFKNYKLMYNKKIDKLIEI